MRTQLPTSVVICCVNAVVPFAHGNNKAPLLLLFLSDGDGLKIFRQSQLPHPAGCFFVPSDYLSGIVGGLGSVKWASRQPYIFR